MNLLWSNKSLIVFSIIIAVTFLIAWKGRVDSNKEIDSNITKQKLNRWLVGLSAGATANSGFVVTGAVGLGYSFGLYWLLLPLGWLLGDLIFWKIFAHRVTQKAQESGSTTLTELISSGLNLPKLHPLNLLTSLITLFCICGYTIAQWIAGQKILSGAFGLSGHATLVMFALVIIAYSCVGKFRGSVYVDVFQSVTRLMGTVIAFITVCWIAGSNYELFKANIGAQESGYLNIIGGSSIVASIGFIVGYLAASLGFGLGQPQVSSRYMASSSPEETKAAKWIYIVYVQFTWVTMTVFGVILKGVMPSIEDPEQGLVIFVCATLPALVIGLIVADIFGTIASTANSLLIAMAQTTQKIVSKSLSSKIPFTYILLTEGLLTMVVALGFDAQASVYTIAITSISFMAAGLAPAVAVKLLDWAHSPSSLFCSVLGGFLSASFWKLSNLSGAINEAAIGISIGLLLNFSIFKLQNHYAKKRN